ncbi:MAG: galactokinase [Thermogutta sp.]|nr:galactokinase [Thermogutta sp.]
MGIDVSAVKRLFSEQLGGGPDWVVRAPGRVNLIGEHTDYNEGFVLPMAVERAVWIGLRRRADRWVRVYVSAESRWREFHLDALRREGNAPIEYVKGTAWSLGEEGFFLRGWEGVLLGDVPIGAGLSSSAAMEVAVARAFAAASDLPWDPVKMALAAQRAENRWVGVQCGIMDQLISACGKEGHALLIDCRGLECRPVPLPQGVKVVILDTGTRRGLADSAYNERRKACESTAARFGLKALRDLSLDDLTARAGELDAVTFRRVRHVVSENARTLLAAQAMEKGDTETLGRLMVESHASLRDDYEVSSEALNAMVEIALAGPGCYGARMTGAGFGGCAVALVEAGAAADFAEKVSAEYRRRTGNQPAVYITGATAGADVVADCVSGA